MRRLLLLLALASFLFSGCAKSPGEAPGLETSPGADSLRAKFTLEMPDASGRWSSFSAVLFSVPGKRYRLELSGPLGVGFASMLWTDSAWTFVFPTERKFLRGRGYMIGKADDASFPRVDIHQLAGFFEGKFLPASYEEVSAAEEGGVRVVEAVDSTGRQFRFGAKDGEVAWLERGTDRADFDGEQISISRGGERSLRIRIKNVRRDVTWNSGVWRLIVPPGYESL